MISVFLSTRPRGARHPLSRCIRSISFALFLSTRPRGARRRPSSHRPAHVSCFYPRARGGRDRREGRVEQFLDVSIHAPAGGATSTCGAAWRLPGRFYPRARGGRDLILPTPHLTRLGVSIHAPAGGATRYMCWAMTGRGFYPRARGGRDLFMRSPSPNSSVFLSTRPRGARLLYPKRLEITKL